MTFRSKATARAIADCYPLIGHHYTPEATAMKVLAGEGLVPQPILKEELLRLHPGLKGTWVWQSPLNPVSHAGTIMFQASSKMTTRVALLEVRYALYEVAVATNGTDIGRLSQFHYGAVGNWVYHTREPAYVITEHVPVERIRLLGVYDIIERLTHSPAAWRMMRT